jgi:iron complex outermembrane recepter protein
MNVSQHKKSAVFSLLTATLLCSSLTASAETTTASTLEPVNVTASAIIEHDYLDPKSPSNPYRVETTAEAGTEIYTEKDIQNLAPKNILDLIDRSVGFDVTYQGRKNPYFVKERGGGSMTYIIDGAILPSITDRILLKIPVSAIEQIQIVRGATSLPMGPSINIAGSNSGAGLNTGFIIIRTKQPKKTMLTLTGGVEDPGSGQPTATKESGYMGLVFGDSSLNAYIGGMKAGMRTPSTEDRFDGTSASTTMINGGINAGRFSTKVMAYNDSGLFEMQRGVKPDGSLDTSKWYYDPTKTHLFTTDATMQWDEHHTTIASYFKTRYFQHEIDTQFPNTKPITTSTSDYYENTSGHSLRHNIQYGATKVMLGMQSAVDEVLGKNGQSTNDGSNTKVNGYGVSVEQGLFENTLTLDAGYRHDTKHLNRTSATYAPDADMPPSIVYAMGAKWNITPKYSLNTRYYQGDQGMQGDFDVKAQTGTLDPESQKRIEATLDAKIMKEFSPAITWFNVKIDNTKSQTTTLIPGTTNYYYTQSDSKLEGLEFLIKGIFNFGTSYQFGWTHMLKNSKTDSSGLTTDSVGNTTPEDLYIARLSHEWDSYRVNISANKKSEWLNTGYKMGDYTRYDANIMKDFKYNNIQGRVSLYGRNLGDEKYVTMYKTGFYYDRGRTIGADITLDF